MVDYSAPPGYNPATALGPALLGMVVTCILTGISCIQASIYYKNYPRDWIVHKITVATVGILNFAHMVMIVHGVYWHAVNGIAVSYIVWSFRVAMVLNTVVVVIILNLYACWLWKIGGAYHRFLPWFVIAVQIAGFGIAAVCIHASFACEYYSDTTKVEWEVIFGLGSSSAADLLLAYVLAVYVRIGKTGLAGVRSQIGQLFLFMVCTGLATSCVSLTSLILFITMPHVEFWMGVEFLLTSVYVNSFYALMNGRRHFKDRTSIPFLSAMQTTMRFVGPAQTTVNPIETRVSMHPREPAPSDTTSDSGDAEGESSELSDLEKSEHFSNLQNV